MYSFIEVCCLHYNFFGIKCTHYSYSYISMCIHFDWLFKCITFIHLCTLFKTMSHLGEVAGDIKQKQKDTIISSYPWKGPKSFAWNRSYTYIIFTILLLLCVLLLWTSIPFYQNYFLSKSHMIPKCTCWVW